MPHEFNILFHGLLTFTNGQYQGSPLHILILIDTFKYYQAYLFASDEAQPEQSRFRHPRAVARLVAPQVGRLEQHNSTFGIS